MQMIQATPDRPVLVWNYKGETYATNKVIVRASSTLRHEQRKFWSSIIKPSMQTEKRGARLTKYNHGKQVCKQKEIYWSYALLPMIHKNLKVSVRFKPFNKSLITKFI